MPELRGYNQEGYMLPYVLSKVPRDAVASGEDCASFGRPLGCWGRQAFRNRYTGPGSGVVQYRSPGVPWCQPASNESARHTQAPLP